MNKMAYLLPGACLLLQSVAIPCNGLELRSVPSDEAGFITSHLINSALHPFAAHTARATQAAELLQGNQVEQMNRNRNVLELALYVNRRTKELLPARFQKQSRAVARAISTQAERYSMDPLLLMALIEQESRFNPHAIGRFGEIGLMQMKPSTALWLLDQGDMVGYTGPHTYSEVREALKDPTVNVAFGAAYLARLRIAFKGRGSLYLAAYNMGGPALKNQLRAGERPMTYANHVISQYVGLGLDFSATGHFNQRGIASLNSTFVSR